MQFSSESLKTLTEPAGGGAAYNHFSTFGQNKYKFTAEGLRHVYIVI